MDVIIHNEKTKIINPGSYFEYKIIPYSVEYISFKSRKTKKPIVVFNPKGKIYKYRDRYYNEVINSDFSKAIECVKAECKHYEEFNPRIQNIKKYLSKKSTKFEK